jgi:hypothetical protein
MSAQEIQNLAQQFVDRSRGFGYSASRRSAVRCWRYPKDPAVARVGKKIERAI